MSGSVFNHPYFVASLTSGVDGASEGGRLSTSRQPATLVLYSVPLLKQIREGGYEGRLDAEPALLDGGWAIKVIYRGPAPGGVPERWHGYRVVLEEAPPEEKKGG